MLPRLTQLRYLVTVAEEGQMTRAARKLHLAQPALSQAIAQLESELGVELLHRNPRGVTPTEAGEAFLAKARTALAATEDAALTAQSFARAASGELRFGFLGLPPFDKAPQLFARFNDAQPQAELSFHELGFPCGSTASWLAGVDMAMCFSPTPDPEVDVEPLWTEPRTVIASKRHPLARRAKLTLKDVLDETFLGCDPSVEETWAGFWRLDDHRGGRAARVTSDCALSASEMAALVASGRAITTLAASSAALVPKVLADVVAIPLIDADPAVLAVAWRCDHHNPLVEAFVMVAREHVSSDGGAPAADAADALSS
ncbi:MAG: LysR family transcriptional regulator [Actinobacteria bacterium]|nr:MAG: LysR family transcriptional regulator [Actinomycetota bacterium]